MSRLLIILDSSGFSFDLFVPVASNTAPSITNICMHVSLRLLYQKEQCAVLCAVIIQLNMTCILCWPM